MVGSPTNEIIFSNFLDYVDIGSCSVTSGTLYEGDGTTPYTGSDFIFDTTTGELRATTSLKIEQEFVIVVTTSYSI